MNSTPVTSRVPDWDGLTVKDMNTADWRRSIPEVARRRLRIWLWCVAGMTAAVLVIGGITRLTLSGLSIVHWEPFAGVIPPLNEAQWQAMFAKYQQFPEYQSWRSTMTLAEFKPIFFWEYLHRLAARTIGLVFLLPFLFFWIRGYFTRPVLARAFVLFGLGAMQGVMGWLMVMSGLVDRPSVSHYRLAAHLVLAFVIFGYAVWLTRELRVGLSSARVTASTRRIMQRGLVAVGILLGVQIVWGAFVAGLKAGKYYPTFPRMGGRLIPADLLARDPLLRNFVENPVAVQWTHRVLGTLLAVAVIVLYTRVRRAAADPMSRRLNNAMLLLIVVQYLLGVFTLLHLVPVALGVMHQFTALVIFCVWLVWTHHVRNIEW